MESEIRHDYIDDSAVIIAPGRAKRPSEPGQRKCFFCPKRIDQKTLIETFGNHPWQIAVLENKFPAVSLKNRKAYGKQEVIIETADHNKQLDELSIDEITQIFDVYSARTESIASQENINYILTFKNGGGKAGSSIKHAHSQIFATNLIPPHIKEKINHIRSFKRKSGCPYCKVIKKEIHGPRIIFKDKNIVAFTPYASMYPYEAWIMPRHHRSNITELTAPERKSTAKILKKILQKINHLNFSYNYYFHFVRNNKNLHFYIKITPRASTWAGVELGSRIIINHISPEEAAKYYRK